MRLARKSSRLSRRPTAAARASCRPQLAKAPCAYIELMMARSDSNESAGVAFPPTVAYLSGLALGWLIGYVHPLRLVPDPYRWPVGVSLLLLWLVVWVVALSQFRAAATTVSTHKPV